VEIGDLVRSSPSQEPFNILQKKDSPHPTVGGGWTVPQCSIFPFFFEHTLQEHPFPVLIALKNHKPEKDHLNLIIYIASERKQKSRRNKEETKV